MVCGLNMCSSSSCLEMLFVLIVVVSNQIDTISACPKDCFCAPHSKNVQCSNQNLLHIPVDIPKETLELNLNENKFQHRGLSRPNFTDLTDLQNLYLSDTGLETISVDTFCDLTQLSWLDVSKNHIRLVADYTFRALNLKHLFLNDNPDLQLSVASFAGMTTQGLYMNHCGLRRLTVDVFGPLSASLKTLWLHGNNFGRLNEKWRYLFRKLAHVRLSGNLFHCNCELSWLHAFYITSRLSLFAGGDQPQCASPGVMKGKNFDDLTGEDFRCELPTFQNVDVVFDNKMGKLTCVARGDPAPTLSWTRPNGSTETFYHKAEAGVARTGAESEQNMAEIHLANNRFDTKEIYKCVAANSAGNVTFSLNVVWPDPGQPPPSKAPAKVTKLNKGAATSSNMIKHEITSAPYEEFHQNYAGDDSEVYNRKSSSDRIGMWSAEMGAADMGQHDRMFSVVDLAGAVVGTFLLTLLMTVTCVHLYCRTRFTSTSSELYPTADHINNKHNVLGVYIMNETEDNSVTMINYRNNTECLT